MLMGQHLTGLPEVPFDLDDKWEEVGVGTGLGSRLRRQRRTTTGNKVMV